MCGNTGTILILESENIKKIEQRKRIDNRVASSVLPCKRDLNYDFEILIIMLSKSQYWAGNGNRFRKNMKKT